MALIKENAEDSPTSELPDDGIEEPHVAVIVDNEVKFVVFGEEFKDVLMSNPVFIETTHPKNGGPRPGWKYNPESNEFQDVGVILVKEKP